MAHFDPQALKSLLDSARSVALLLPSNPSYDAVAAALGLKLSLEQAGKTVVMASAEPITVEFNRLVGINTVSQSFGKRDLVITFPGQTEMVDKVSYNVDKGELQLIVTPKPNVVLDPSKLKFVAGGTQADAAILIGTDNVKDLGKIYDDAKEYLDGLNPYSLTGPRLCEYVTLLLTNAQLTITPDCASNLLAGLERATNAYQTPDVTADTFEAAAILMRQGGRRHDVYAPEKIVPGSVPQQQPAKSNEDWYEPKVYRGTSVS
jgi:c-di-AMP phosphodiesterase-like protein